MVTKNPQKHFLCPFWGFLVTIICDIKNWRQCVWTSLCQFIFLGGLSLHLNHLIGSRMRISFGSFGTLPIGILFSNLGSGQLMTCPRTLFGQIWNMSLFDDSRAVRVIMPKYRPFRKPFFSRWRSGDSFSRLGVLGGQMAGLYGGTIFGGGARHLGALAGLRIRRFHF